MKYLLKRLKDPLVITQLISIIGGLVMFFIPDSGEAAAAAVVAAAIAIVNVLAAKK